MVLFKLVCIVFFACTTGALPFESSSSNADLRNEHNRPKFANVESHAEVQVQFNYKLNIVEHYGGASKEDTKSNAMTNTTSARKVQFTNSTRWEQNGTTVAGGNGQGHAANQLFLPWGLVVDDDDTVIVADWGNERVVEWKEDDTSGRVVAGGNGSGRGMNQLNRPSDVIIDKETNSLVVCDFGNRRVMRWSRQSGTTSGELLIANIGCWGLAMDDQRNLYVPDEGKHEVRRFRMGEKTGTLVAGGNGKGSALNQLNSPAHVFVDRERSVYVSDHLNHRVMKWAKNATEGIIVAGGRGQGSALTQLNFPYGLFVDEEGTVYVSDWGNGRVTRWAKGASQGTNVVGGNGVGSSPNQLIHPAGLSFDRHGNLYVADWANHRVQRFSIVKN